MSDILEKFNVFSKLSQEFKQSVKLFHIFDDFFEFKNYLLVTNDDKVFSFGSNKHGQCGLGHVDRVDAPKEIIELSGKQVKQFFVGNQFVLALNQQNQVFSWGQNNFGQLGRGNLTDQTQLLKPEIIPTLVNIIEISCAHHHTLALDSMGNVYSWGSNHYGQLGCGNQLGPYISSPIQIKTLTQIKSIYCCLDMSFAITYEGLVYSWGYNRDFCLGHESEESSIFEPKLIIGLNNVVSIAQSLPSKSFRHENNRNDTYFLTNEGTIYFCGGFDWNSKNAGHQKTPSLLMIDMKFQSLQTAHFSGSDHFKFFRNYPKLLALSDGTVYCLERNTIKKTKYKSFFEYYMNERQMTFQTVEREFIKLGTGRFGTVFKWFDKKDQRDYALKKVEISEQGQSLERLQKEVSLLSKCSEEFVVKYFDSWINENYFYMKLELFSTDLYRVIEDKTKMFGRATTNEMTVTEYFITSHLLKEILECVLYLHQLKPPIIHRNLKPQNFLLYLEPKNGRFLKISDLGFAAVAPENGETTTHTLLVGTPKYMAPEVFGERGRRSIYSTKADVYSLGILICDMFKYDFNDLNEELKGNADLKSQWVELEDVVDKMINSRYHRRPTLAEIYARASGWLVDKSAVKEDLDLVTTQPKGFLYNYLSYRLGRELFDPCRDPNRTTLIASFDKIADLNAGSFGSVISARHKKDQQLYAIKIINIKIDERHSLFDYQKEIKFISKCSDDYVVKYFDSWIENDKLYIQMELCLDNLKNILKQKTECFQRTEFDAMSATEFFISSNIFKDILECTHYLHSYEPDKSIIHRDLKPDNILVVEDSKNGKFIKLADFGLATFCKTSITQQHSMGTAKYMAPEVMNSTYSKPKYSPKTDIYSLGKVLADVFDYDMNSLELYITKNPVLEKQWAQVESLVDDMLTTRYSKRPNTTQIFQRCNFWEVDMTQVDGQLDILKNYKHKFFYNYLISKINSIEANQNRMD